MRYVRLATVEDVYQAHTVEHALEEEGIRCIVAHENTTTMIPVLNGIMGAGIEIRVLEVDFLAANAILEKLKKEDVLKCPECGSQNLDYGVGTKSTLLRIFGSAAVMSVFGLAGKSAFVYKCRDCGTEFRKNQL